MKDVFDGKLGAARHTLEALVARCRALPPEQRALVEEALAFCSAAVVELQEAGEKLRQQNGALLAVQNDLEASRQRYRNLEERARLSEETRVAAEETQAATPLLVGAAPVQDSVGQIINGVTVFQDITDLRKTEQALRANEEKYRALFNSIDEGFCIIEMIFDANGKPVDYRFLEVNSAFEKYTGLREVEGKSIHQLATNHEAHWLETYGKVARTGEATHFVNEAKALGRWYDVYAFGVGAPESRKVAVLFTDITERMQARKVLLDHAEELEQQVEKRTAALQASHARFRAIFEDAAIGIALVNQDAHVITGNPALQRILGYSIEELKGMSLAALTHPDNAGADLKLYNELIAGERPYYQMEGRYVRKDGHPIYVNVTVSLVQWQDVNARFAIVMLEDISARKEAQAALVRSEKLALTGKLAASLAHEINNPLQSVLGFMSLVEELLEENEEKAKEDARTYIRIAIEEVKRAADLVRQMRNINRPSALDERKPVDVNTLVERVLTLSQKKCQEQHVQVTWKAADDVALVSAIPDQIHQVFLNLTLNALDAMPDGGELHISTARTEAPAGVEICFADDGEGIAPDKLGHLFEPFYTTKTTGMGLGLYISQKIIQEHGGRMNVESVAGEGTAFTVWLPMQRGTE